MYNPLFGRLGAGAVAKGATAAGGAAAGGGLMSLLGGPVGIGLTALSVLPDVVGMFSKEEEPPMGGGIRTQSPFLASRPRYQDMQRQQGNQLYDILSLLDRR